MTAYQMCEKEIPNTKLKAVWECRTDDVCMFVVGKLCNRCEHVRKMIVRR